MIASHVRRIDIGQRLAGDAGHTLRTEWLIANGLGGYSSGSVSGMVTRRYHGLLVAALPAPWGRVVMLNHLHEHLVLPDGRRFLLGGEAPHPDEHADTPRARSCLCEFRLEDGLPCWRYEAGGHIIEKRLVLVHEQNTLFVIFRLESGPGPAQVELYPWMSFRRLEAAVNEPLATEYTVTTNGKQHTVSANEPGNRLRFFVHGTRPRFSLDGGSHREIEHFVEAERGYVSSGVLWSPGCFSVSMEPGETVALVASTESWSQIHALKPEDALASEQERRQRLIAAAPEAAREGVAAELVLAADQFIIKPAGRVEDVARARASGDDVRTVIAGYHWFTDWGRDTMISLEGLTLCTGRHIEAGWILRTFALYIRDGLIPNYFPDGASEGVYHTADATLWFFHALDRYLEVTKDEVTLRAIMPKLKDIIAHHVKGTHYGIGVDPADGLLRQGAEGYQLTWMDAKVGDWVVTPRRGKAVEINALWYSALRLTQEWTRVLEGDEAAAEFAQLADRVRVSFNQRFWSDELGHLLDVIDGESGDDAACRPNQVLAISPRHAVLDESRWSAVLDQVAARLLTPYGLRSLAPGHPDYKSRYFGDLRSRDAAYHQGTVWTWLIGPFTDAWLKVHPGDLKGARNPLHRFGLHMEEACIGTINEIFDAEPPFTPRGCIAQAWSVAEVLRCWLKTEAQPADEPVVPA